MKTVAFFAALTLLSATTAMAQEPGQPGNPIDLAPQAAEEEAQLDDLIKNSGDTVPLNYYLTRGVARFFQAKIDGSLEDFDKVAVDDTVRPNLWQRGLSLYYAGRFEEGVKQFEEHQTVNGNDVENAAWHFLCVVRQDGIEAARKNFIPIEGDSRPGMSEIHQLFAGKAEPADVLAVADSLEGEAKRNALCYAHLYLGLYFEATGDEAKAKEHMKLAAVDHAMAHYMGQVPRVHRKVRGWE